MGDTNQSAARFTLELPLVVGHRQVREIERRMEAHRQVYNAALGEALKRYHRMRNDLRWRKAGAMTKGKERTQAFRDLGEEFGFTKNSLQKFACELAGDFYMKPYLGSSDTEETSNRAFTAVQMYVFNPWQHGRSSAGAGPGTPDYSYRIEVMEFCPLTTSGNL